MCLRSEHDLAGISVPSSHDPLLVSFQTRQSSMFMDEVRYLGQFMTGVGTAEWTGLVNFDPLIGPLGSRTGHVYDLLKPRFPLRAEFIRGVELDVPSEIPRMAVWLRELGVEFLGK
jgi:hypothetical protein